MYVTEVSDFELLSEDFDKALSSLSVPKRLRFNRQEILDFRCFISKTSDGQKFVILSINVLKQLGHSLSS